MLKSWNVCQPVVNCQILHNIKRERGAQWGFLHPVAASEAWTVVKRCILPKRNALQLHITKNGISQLVKAFRQRFVPVDVMYL